MGVGNDHIINDGSITVASLADAHSYAYADTRDNNLADEYETSRATSEAVAVGIHGGAGNNTIENTGSLNVSAKALAQVYAGGGHVSVTASTHSIASATGIGVGDGGSYIHNAGTIDVHALAYYINGVPTHGVSTIGIIGSEGDDIIVNEGQITTAMYSGVYVIDALAITRPGLGIDAGAGNDAVFLVDGSHITGDVTLGPGDDTLTLTGNPVINGQILAGEGTDTLLFDGAGSFSHTMQQFNHAVKQGTGTYSIAGLTPLSQLDVREGILQINSDYQFPETGLFKSITRLDGSHGQLKIVGTGGLDGTLAVERQQGLYRKHMTYDIITADALNGSFGEVDLPDSTSLLKFSMQQTQDRVQVSVTPQSYTSVASNKVERNIGEYLDRIIPQATGNLSNMLGTFQSLSPDELSTAFASLSPALYDAATTTTFDITSQYTHTLVKRMHSMRSHIESTNAALAYSQTERHATWIDGFGHWASQDKQDGFVGFDYHLTGAAVGADRFLREGILAGISYGQSNADIDMDNDMGNSNIESYFGSLYGSYFTERMYFDTTLSYGRQFYDNVRLVEVGAFGGAAHSDHHGNVYSAYAETGWNINLKKWTLQPFAALRYTLLDEQSYDESGVAGVNLRVEGQKTDALVSDLGLRFAYPFKKNTWLCIPEATVVWNHDFDLDDRRIVSAFDGSPTMTFITDGRDIDEDGAILGASLTLINRDNVSISMKYTGELRNHYEAHALSGGIRYEF
jgi:outer membrane autotransporter protein